jgi:alkylation response protein AidB-like acyl-CoA dehydrogenase
MPNVVAQDSLELAEAFGELLRRQLRGAVLSDDYFTADYSALWAVIVDGGWLDLAVPAADGGAGLTLPDLTAVAEAWGRHLIPLPFIPTLVLRRLPGLRAAASPADMLTTALPQAGAELLVPWPGAGTARYAAWPEPGSGSGSTGPVLTGLPAILGRDSFAPSLPLGVAPGPYGIPNTDVLARLTVLWGAESVGAAAGAFQVAFGYAGQRVAFGRKIAEFQAVKHRMADMYQRLELARTAALWAANSAPADCARGTRLAVGFSREVVEGAVQVMGGMGFTWEAGVHFYLRHILAVGRLTATRRQADGGPAA